jgi:hypothetical protein
VRSHTYHKYTQADLEYIKQHCRDDPREVAATINAPYTTVYNYMLDFRNGTFKRSRRPPDFYYAIYLRKTDELVCSGTARECAEHLGMSKTTFHAMVCKVRKGITKKWDVYVEPYSESLE